MFSLEILCSKFILKKNLSIKKLPTHQKEILKNIKEKVYLKDFEKLEQVTKEKERRLIFSYFNFKDLDIFPPYLFQEKTFLLAAIQQNGYALKYASEFRNDREIVLAAFQQTGWCFDTTLLMN